MYSIGQNTEFPIFYLIAELHLCILSTKFQTMKKSYLLLGFILMSELLAAQSPKWVNYANDYFVSDILPTDDYVWVSTPGGLERIDRKTRQRKIFQPWNSGLRGIGVEAVNIAPDDTIWVSSNRGGLLRFDGEKNWDQFYDINAEFPLVQISELEITPEGNLWFISFINGTCTGCEKVFFYDGTNFSEHQDIIANVLGSSNIGNLTLDQTGALWVSSGLVLARYDYANNDVIKLNIPLIEGEGIYAIGFDKQNTLWVSTYKHLSGACDFDYRIRYFDGNIWAEVDEATIGGDILPIGKMFCNVAGDFYVAFDPWYGEASAFAKFDGNSWEYTKVSDLPNLPPAPNATLHTVDDQGHLWFRGPNWVHEARVYEFDGQKWISYNTEIYPLASNYVGDVAVDCDNNTWFGGTDMLTKFDGISWKDYTMHDMGFNTDYFSIESLTVDTTNCNLWMAFNQNTTNTIAFAKFDGSIFTNYSTPNGSPAREIAIAKDGTVWVASMAGLGKFDGNTWTWYNEQNSPIGKYVNSVQVDHEQNVWISTSFDNAIARWDGTSWLVFDENNSPVSGHSYWVFVDDAGMIWTSNKDGLLRYNGAGWQFFSVPGTGSQGIRSMAQDQEHDFWLSNRDGVHKWNGSTFESYNFLDHPLASPYASRVRVDPFGNKWFLHNSSDGATIFNERGISNHVINPTSGVSGTVFFDADQDGEHDLSIAEPGIPNQKVVNKPDHTTILTNFDGHFTFFPSPGQYQLNYSGDEIFTPTTAQNLPLNMGTNELSGFNFGAWAVNTFDSISLNMSVGLMRCNEEMNVWLSITNYGFLEAEGDITMLYDPTVTFLHAEPQPDEIQGNLLTWHYNGLSMFELEQIKVVFQAPGVDVIGQILSFQSDVTVLENGIVTASAEQDERVEFVCSYDPNDKASASVGPSVDQYSLLNDALDFTIRFQNSGNDTAFTVVLRDTLDTNLDISTLQIVASSHAMRTSMSADGVLTFVFDNINLLWESVDYAGSQGFVKYRIAPKSDLPDPTELRNTAHIFFDFNPAIVTNTTLNVLVETLPSSGATEVIKDVLAARVYPNPNTGDFWIEWLDQATAQTSQATVIDIAGRIHRQLSFVGQTTKIQDLAPGFYFVFLENAGKTTYRKLVVTGN